MFSNVVFDLDGTLSDHSHRFKLAPKKSVEKTVNEDWVKFNEACVDDTPIEQIVNLLKDFDERGNFVAILTSRNNDFRGETENWLREHEIPYGDLWMRASKDNRPSPEFKLMTLESLGYDPESTIIVEDNTKVTAVLRANGYTVLQVADNPF